MSRPHTPLGRVMYLLLKILEKSGDLSPEEMKEIAKVVELCDSLRDLP